MGTTVQIEGRAVRLKTEYANVAKCQMIPGGRWNKTGHFWEWPLTPTVAWQIAEHFGNFEGDRERIFEYCANFLSSKEVKKNGGALYDYEGPEPWPHQRTAYQYFAHLTGIHNGLPGGGCLLGMDMGTGKTRVAIDIMRNYQHRIRKSLMLAPLNVVNNWAAEFYKYWKQSRHYCLGPEYKSVGRKAQHAFNFWRTGGGTIVTNYEAVWREPFAQMVLDEGLDLVVCDEIHRIKDPGGRASKFFANLSNKVQWRGGLSGTPLAHSPLDGYAEYRYLDPGVFGKSFTTFRGRYAIMGGFQQKQVVGFKCTDEFTERFYMIAYRVKMRDVLPDLPEHEDVYRYVELSEKERDAYTQMETEFVIELESGVVVASNALVKLLRLQQITSGHVDGTILGDSKLKALMDVLEDLDPREPVVIFCRFTPDIAMIKRELRKTGRKVSEVSGAIKEDAEWKAGETDVIVCQIQAASLGVDFTRACYTIYYSQGYSLSDYDQSRRRMDRPGQTRPGQYIHLAVKKSVDMKVLRALRKRADVVESVLTQYAENNEDNEL